jgi:hypothetical protein
MAQCITCGTELHPERAQKYDYCMAPACQEKNAKGLTMVAIGMNKAADELVILDEPTREALANGKYQDQRRGSFGPPAPSPAAARPATGAATSSTRTATPRTEAATRGTGAATRGTGAATHGTEADTPSPAAAMSGSNPVTPTPGTAAANAPTRAAGRPARRPRPQPSRPTPASTTRPRWTASQERLALLYNQQGLRPDEIADKLGVSTYLATQIVLAARSHRKA